MPPSSTIGIDNGKAPRKIRPAHSERGTGSSRGMSRLTAITCTTNIINPAIRKPGTTPPKNKAPTDAPDTSA